MNLDKAKKLNIPKSPGVYQFYNNKKIIYIGKASDLRSRVLSYWQKSVSLSPAKNSMLKQVKKIDWIETDSEIEALLLEANLIKKYQPEYNITMRDDKRYVYVKISTDDGIPGLFMTRKIDKSGKYFGPFTSVEPVRQTLKAIRKIWPYCNAKRLQNLPARLDSARLDGKAGKPCFYYQINRCLGICGGLVSKKEYMDSVVKPIILFLEGKKGRIIRDLKKKRKELGKKGETDEALKIDYSIKNMERVLEHTKILSLVDKYAADVIELAKVFSLPKVPERIEGYDISNIFGKEAVGSMVVFREGEPDKNEYRKFKIKVGQGQANDIRMLKEILIRRFKRVASKKWSLPDLIIVDGGRGQLNIASRVLKKYKIDLPAQAGIPVIAISKGAGLRSALAPDKLFFLGEKKPLELPLTSPALHLIKRVCDEAHRFAITYHRKLKRKKMY